MERDEHREVGPKEAREPGETAWLSEDALTGPPLEEAPGEGEPEEAPVEPAPASVEEELAAGEAESPSGGPSEGAPAGPAPKEPPRRGEVKWLPVAVAAGLGLLLLLAGAALWQTRSDLAATKSQVAALQESARRSELVQTRAAVRRARAELESLREALPPELSAEVARADGILAGVANRLAASR